MSFFNQQATRQNNTVNLLKLQKQMQGIKNEMEFVEILAQFWPLPNMSEKMERLEQKLNLLSNQYNYYTAAKAS